MPVRALPAAVVCAWYFKGDEEAGVMTPAVFCAAVQASPGHQRHTARHVAARSLLASCFTCVHLQEAK